MGPLWQHVYKQFILTIIHNWGTIKHGVPHGSILCPLSFPLSKQSTQNFEFRVQTCTLLMSVKVKVNMYSADVSKRKVPVHAMKASKGITYIAAFILNLDMRWRWVVSLNILATLLSRAGICRTSWIGGWVDPRTSQGILEKEEIPCLYQDLNLRFSRVERSHCTDWAVLATCYISVIAYEPKRGHFSKSHQWFFCPVKWFRVNKQTLNFDKNKYHKIC